MSFVKVSLPGALAVVLFVAGCSTPAPATAPVSAPTSAAPAATAVQQPAIARPAAAPASPAALGSPLPAASPVSSPVAASTAAAPVAAAQPAVKLTIGYSEIYEGNIPLWVAKEAGFLQKHGLDADLQYAASATAIAALLSNQIQISNGGGSEAVSAVSGGADLMMVATTIPVQPYVFEAPADVKTIDDLRGKRVGVSSAGSSSDIATRVGLKRVGLDPDKDVTIVAVGSEQNRNAALLSGSIQGGLSQPPGSIDLEKQGLHPLFNMAELKLPTLNNTVVVQRSYATSNRAVVQGYVDAMIESIAWCKANKAKVLPIMQQYLKVDDQDTLSKTYDYAFTDLFAPLPYPKVEQFTDTVETLAPKNPAIRNVDLTKIIDESFVKSAADRGLDRS